MTGINVERATFTEMSVLGVAFIAGLTSGNIFCALKRIYFTLIVFF